MLLLSTGNTSLLVESSNYLTQHLQQEGQWTSPSNYWPTYDNVAWPAAILLLGQLQHQAVDPEATAASAAMEQHHEALSQMFRGWMAGKVSRPVLTLLAPTVLQLSCLQFVVSLAAAAVVLP